MPFMNCRIVGIRLENIRTFEGTHFIEFHDRLTVVIGKNNTGKSTVQRTAVGVAAFMSGDHDVLQGLARSAQQRSAASIAFETSAAEFWPATDVPPGTENMIFQSRENLPLTAAPGLAHFGRGSDDLVRFEIRCRPGPEVTIHLWSNAPSAANDGVEFSRSRGRAVGSDGVEYKPDDRLLQGLDSLGPKVRLSERISAWSYQARSREHWMNAHRLVNDETAAVCEALRFLKMKHDRYFRALEAAVLEAFPEFSKLDFDASQGKYDPCFVPRVGDEEVLVARGNFGAGSWAFLSILAAAYVAKATGATTLFLDEPHLYMHPGLERRLIRTLTDDTCWPDGPLQLVVATHSPAFVDHALRMGRVVVLDWADKKHTNVQARSLAAGTQDASILQGLATSPAELVYADRVVYVEGPSDAAAIGVLAEHLRLPYRPRIEPLREADMFTRPHYVDALKLLARAVATGPVAPPLVVLDEDKRGDMERLYGVSPKLAPQWHPVVFLGKRGNDFESLFCEKGFLLAYLRSRGVPFHAAEQPVEQELRQLRVARPKRKSPIKKSEKGSAVVASLHQTLLQDADERTKEDYLVSMMQFLVANHRTVACSPIWRRLEELRAALVLGGASAAPAEGHT